ncbi:MAG: glycosyltransferase family 39 protein [Chloroflexota bacterium]
MSQKIRMTLSRSSFIFAIVALIASSILVYSTGNAPDFFDAYYHYHVAENLATGDGFTEDFVWVYINPPERLPAPAYRYWMPATSWIAAAGMAIFGAQFWAAQLGFVLCTWGMMLLTYGLGKHFGHTERLGWVAGFCALLYSNHLVYWGQIDTSSPYALVGGGALLLIGMGVSASSRQLYYWIGAGILVGFGHLLRNDGLLLLFTGWAVLLYPFDRENYLKRIGYFVIFTTVYALTMTPWFLRSLDVIGTPLASDGLLTVTMLEYVQIFSYPAEASDVTLSELLAVRWDAFREDLIFRILLFNGLLLLTVPLIIAFLKRWQDRLVRPVWIFILGMHTAFLLIFPLPAVHGTYMHGHAALVPMLAVFGVLGVEDIIGWVGKRRKNWNINTAKAIFSTFFALLFMLGSIALANRPAPDIAFVDDLVALTDETDTIMSVDPGAVHYHTDRVSILTPYADLDTIYEVASLYEMDYLLTRTNTNYPALDFGDMPPEFLEEITWSVETYRLFRFVYE